MQENLNNSKEGDALDKRTSRFITFLKSLFSIGKIDYVKASENIKADVSFKGFNIWILISSILVCSLGLNLNSTPVVIGAMLISPLMGPINGIGLALGTFDKTLLKRSLLNISVAAGVSILTAYLFFEITPTGDDLHELFSRKTPVILDLLIAFFGGIAGILAASRCITNNVVPGVAIATALMPPLCTAGYGLATGQMDYFLGAFYLFFMNCVMISLAAVLIVLYLRYPKFTFMDKARKWKVRAVLILGIAIFSVPSIILYYKLLKDRNEADRVKEYLEKEFHSNPLIYVDDYKVMNTDSGKVLRISLKGQYLDQKDVIALQRRLTIYKLNDYKLVPIQPEYGLGEDAIHNIGQKFTVDILSDLYEKNTQILESKEDEIKFLQNEITKLSAKKLAGDKLAGMIYSQYDVEEVAIENMIYMLENKRDTIPTVLVKWKPGVDRKSQKQKLTELMKIQLEVDQLNVYDLN